MKDPKIPKGFKKLEGKFATAEIADELCYCGCLKSQHAGTNGHGPCMVCEDCVQYTYKCFLGKVAEGNKAKEKLPLHSNAVSVILEKAKQF